MSFDKIFDLTAGVYFNFYNIYDGITKLLANFIIKRYHLITKYHSHRTSDPASNTDQPQRVYSLVLDLQSISWKPLRDVAGLKSRGYRKCVLISTHQIYGVYISSKVIWPCSANRNAHAGENKKAGDRTRLIAAKVEKGGRNN